MKDNQLLTNAEQLAVGIEFLCKSLEHKDNSNIIFQIRKSSSSVFANITEAQYPQSLADMQSKFKIVRKECVETESVYFESDEFVIGLVKISLYRFLLILSIFISPFFR